MIYKAIERALPTRSSHPRGYEPSSQYKIDFRAFASYKADYRESTQGLAEVIQRYPNKIRVVKLQELDKTFFKVREKGILLWSLSSPDEIAAPHRGEFSVLIVCQAEANIIG
jgi:hypothetical protein